MYAVHLFTCDDERIYNLVDNEMLLNASRETEAHNGIVQLTFERPYDLNA